MKIIDERRSIRSFLSQEVEDYKIEAVLKAAMQAPSAGNQRPWHFFVVRNREVLEKLSELSPYAKMIGDAPVALVLVGEPSKMMFKENWEQDMAACTQNVLLEIVHQELGGVWLGVAPLEDRMAHVKKVLDLNQAMPFAVVPFGYSNKKNEYIDRYEADRVTFID